MHNGIRRYVARHLDKLRGKVLEVGSLDVNGCVRDLVPHAIGTDMQAGKNVDVVCAAEALVERFGENVFDGVISLDAFEHMEDWRGCLTGMWDVLKPQGYLVMTMAGLSKGRHNYPSDYWRCEWAHVIKIFPKAEDCQTFPPSMGWVVRKTGPLPDLSVIELLKVP